MNLAKIVIEVWYEDLLGNADSIAKEYPICYIQSLPVSTQRILQETLLQDIPDSAGDYGFKTYTIGEYERKEVESKSEFIPLFSALFSVNY